MPMKTMTLLTGLTFCIANFASAQNAKEQLVNSEVESVIIYLDGVEVSRSKSVSITPGKTKIIFTGLSHRLDDKTIQIKSSEDIAIHSITTKIDHLTKSEEKPRIKQVRDSLKLMKRKAQYIKDEQNAYAVEKTMVIANQHLSGKDKGVSTIELKQAADFYRSRIKEINLAVSKSDVSLGEYNAVIAVLRKELQELNASNSFQQGEISILVSAKVATKSTFTVKYLVSSAGWVPIYDIKVADINQPIELIYRAKVYNNTGIDWKNVKMKLSTADPHMSASKPILTPWYLNYKTKSSSLYKNKYRLVGVYNQQLDVNTGNLADLSAKKEGEFFYSEISVSDLSAEFEIAKAYTIPADANAYIVEIKEIKIPATYKHYSAPKLDRNAYLIARVGNWEELDLVEGQANIYFGGTYIGQSYINTRSVSDTLDISMGRDKKILVTRVKKKEFSSKKFIGSNRKEVYAYEIMVKNNRKSPIEIDIVDQLPVSQDSEIQVSKIEISGAKENELSGELKWKYKLEPGETKTINLSFSIKYPKNKPITIGQKRKRKVRAKF